MPRWLDDLGIDRKLVLIMMLTVGAALVAACMTFALSDSLSTYRSAKGELATLAGIVANNSVSALTFGDAEAAEETLRALASTESIVSACLYGLQGEVLTRYARSGASARCPTPPEAEFAPRFDGGEIAVMRSVHFEGERLGAVYLRSDLSRLYARLGPYLLGTLLALGVSSSIALLLSARLKNLITLPILRLASIVDGISGSREYSARVEGARGDEIGRLIQGFNNMLEQVQLRDAELRSARDGLERRVIERTAELEVARDAAQAASRAKSEFLANMSHEIRTPLNAVVGLTEVTLRTDLDDTQRDYLNTVLDSAESLLGVLNDILDFSKIEAGKLDLDRVPFSVFDTVEDTLTSLAMRAEQKGIELACYVDPTLPPLMTGDPGRLRQVITNLVSNAIKFTERGEVVLRVDPETRGPSMLTRFSVTDTGIGISSNQLDRLFEPFEQADASTTRRFGGTGLGLAISRRLVEMMGGQIRAQSKPGRGSTFSFSARFDVLEGAQDRPRSELLALAGVRVLIVDDNATNRAILAEMTRARRMRPDGAGSADEAFARIVQGFEARDPYRVLLSDLHMPEQDGFHLAERIRRDPRFDDLAIMLLSSAGQTGELAQCQELGIAERLLKPVKQSELIQVMARSLERGGARTLPVRSPRRATPTGDAGGATAVAPLRILLVEDSAANRKVVCAMLGGQGHDIAVAENGREALEKLAEHEYDVVLMDVQMPEMDGFEATAALRARERSSNRHLPVIAMTAHALQGDREKCLAAGMDDYVPKPLRRDELFGALSRAAARANRS